MEPADKKQALRLFTYGLYIVMCKEGSEVNAFTANWLTQVSFEPPLVAVSIENTARSLPMILRSRHFTINVLGTGDRELAGKLGKSSFKHPEKMADVDYTLFNDSYAILQKGLGWTGCEMRHTVPAGDSTLVIAEVVEAGLLNTGNPLSMAEAGFKHAG